MPQYRITDPTSGRSITLTGDSPPTEAELSEIFSKVNAQPAASSEPAQPEGSAVGRFLSGAGEMLNPVTMIRGLGQAVAHPIDTASALIGQQVQQGKQAADLVRQGRYVEAAGHGLAAALPLVGPVAAQAGEQIAEGDIAGGLGKGTGLIGGVLAPAAIAKARVKVPALLRNTNPAAVEAIALAERAGVPIDAATATGNRAVRAVQHVSDRSLGGSFVAEKAAQAQAKGLATLGEQLAAKGHPVPVTAEQAGQAARDAVAAQIKAHGETAAEAYNALRALESMPENAKTVQLRPLDGPAGALGRLSRPVGRFAKPGASTEDLFQGVLGDARRGGFTGSADDLRAEFYNHLRSARDLGKSMAEGEGYGGDAALLKDIRKLGGLKPFENEHTAGAPTRKLRGEFENFQRGRTGSLNITNNKGLAYDDLLDQLHQGGKWADIEDVSQLKERLDLLSRVGPKAGGSNDLEHLLAASGVKPGAKWWQAKGSEETVPLPVDLRAAKANLQPMYEELKRQAELTPAGMMGSKATAYQALDKLVKGPDYAPLSTVDAALGDLKSFIRTDTPELRTAGQAKIVGAVGELDKAVQQAASNAGPLAVEALDAGRKATIAKYGAPDVLDGLERGTSSEPVRMFNRLVARDDAAIAQLRDVAKQAPAELPKIGRAMLDDLLAEATADGGFSKAGTIASKWEKLGPETKRLLYKDPGYVRDLDSFFRLVRMTAENANPSGTAHTLLVAGQGGLMLTNPITGVASALGTAAISKLLHSSAGVRLLTKGLSLPVGNRGMAAAVAAEIAARVGTTSPSGSQIRIAGLEPGR